MIAISERAVKGLFVSDLDFHFTEYLTENAPKTTTHLSSPPRKRGSGASPPNSAPWITALAGMSALREDALFAWWKSVSEPVVGSVIEGNCVAVRRGGEQPEMNRQSVG